MEISELTLKIILILIPGFISSVIYERLMIHKSWSPFKFVINSIIFGSLSYLLAQAVFSVFNCASDFDSFWENLPTKEIPYKAIIKATIISILISIASVVLDFYKIPTYIGRKLKITNKYGDESLFYYFLNQKDLLAVYVRDIENNLTYLGDIVAYSENDGIAEIVLRDVVVYSYEDSEEYYKVSEIYISRKKENLIIEKPKLNK